MMVLHKDDEEEYQVEVRGLQEHQVYEFWVTAATASGEGEMSLIVARKPNARGEINIYLIHFQLNICTKIKLINKSNKNFN